MFDKSKYDIMKKDMKGSGLLVISLFIKLLRLNSKLKKGKISQDQMDIEMYIMLEDFLPLIKKVSHISYENSKDLETVDKKQLLEYLQKRGINSTQFCYNYAKTKSESAKILMAFAIFDRDDIQLPSFKSPEMILKLLDGESIECIFDSLGDEAVDALSDVLDDDFRLCDLREEDVQLLENYHNRYMDQNIYPKVTKQVTPEMEIIKMAKSLGKSKKK